MWQHLDERLMNGFILDDDFFIEVLFPFTEGDALNFEDVYK
jgi:hypothetical protein